jgi:hypothetical protein
MSDQAAKYTEQQIKSAFRRGRLQGVAEAGMAVCALVGAASLFALFNNEAHGVQLDQGNRIVFNEYGVVTLNDDRFDFIVGQMTPLAEQRWPSRPIDFNRINSEELGRIAELAGASLAQYMADFKVENPQAEIPNWLVGSHMFFTEKLTDRAAQPVPSLD